MRVRAALTCGHRRYFECGWELRWFGKVAVAEFPSGSTTFPATDSRLNFTVLGLQKKAYIPLDRAGLKSNQIAVHYPGHYCTLGDVLPRWPLLRFPGLTAGQDYRCISPLAAFTAPSDSMRTGPQGGGFQVTSSLFLQVLYLNCVVSFTIASSSGWHPRVSSTAYIDLKVSWTLLTNSSKGSFQTLGFTWESLWFVGKQYHSKWHKVT